MTPEQIVYILEPKICLLVNSIVSSQFSLTVVSDSLRPCGLQHARLLSFTLSRSLLKLRSIESVMPSNHLILCTFKILTPNQNPPSKQETWLSSLGQEDPLEKELTTHSSILACEITWTEESGGLQSVGLQRTGCN